MKEGKRRRNPPGEDGCEEKGEITKGDEARA